MDKIIARRTIIDGLIGFIIMGIVIFSIFLSKEKFDTMNTILSVISILTSLFIIIKCFLTPNVVIIHKNNKLVIFPKTRNECSIKFDDIISASHKFASGHRLISGIILNTKNGGINVEFIRNRKAVCKEINSILFRYQESRKIFG